MSWFHLSLFERSIETARDNALQLLASDNERWLVVIGSFVGSAALVFVGGRWWARRADRRSRVSRA